MSFNLDDYVDVAERERQLFDRYPDARIQVDLVEVRDEANRLTGWAAKATIWRSQEDPLPVCDWAVEPVPGKTPYTRDSEAMNASTSAVGRAIVLAGFPTKKIASANEVLARQSAGDPNRNQANPSEGVPVAAQTASPAESLVSQAQAAQTAAKQERTPQDGGDPGEVVITLGKKYAGKKIGEVPRSYLEWLTSKFEPRTAEQRRIVFAANIYLGRDQEALVGGGLSPADDDIPF